MNHRDRKLVFIAARLSLLLQFNAVKYTPLEVRARRHWAQGFTIGRAWACHCGTFSSARFKANAPVVPAQHPDTHIRDPYSTFRRQGQDLERRTNSNRDPPFFSALGQSPPPPQFVPTQCQLASFFFFRRDVSSAHELVSWGLRLLEAF